MDGTNVKDGESNSVSTGDINGLVIELCTGFNVVLSESEYGRATWTTNVAVGSATVSCSPVKGNATTISCTNPNSGDKITVTATDEQGNSITCTIEL